MEVLFKGDQSPEGAVVPYMEWNGITGVQFFHQVLSLTASFLMARSVDYSKTPNLHVNLLNSDVNPRAQNFL